MIAPDYIVKVIALDGTVIADPLPAQAVRFDRRLSLPGDRQLGTFTVDLIPPRGPNAHHMAIYELLDYVQRVEIYEDETLGEPVFAGYIIDLDSTLLSWSISGEDWLGRLGHRRLGHYEPFFGTVTGADMMAYVLDVWDHNQFYDDFNRASVGGDWTTISGTWAVVTAGSPARQWLGTTSGGPSWEIQHTLALSTSQDDRFRVRIEFQAGTLADDWSREFAIFRGGTGEWLLTATHTATEEKTLFLLTQTGADDFQRHAGKYELPFEKRASIDFWIEDSTAAPTVQTCEVWLNGRQFIISESTVQGIGGTLALVADETNALFDNVIIFTREALMTPNITAAGSTIGTEDEPLESPQDTQLQMLSFFADNIFYEWRTRARADAGQDIIDLASKVGSDLSATTRLVEGVNLQNLQLNPSGKALTTWYRFAGQGNDVNMALAEAFDKTAIGNFGIIENQLSDQRISTVDLAQQKAENELIRAKDGQASMAATVFMHPGLEFDVGDTVWVEATSPDIAQTAKVVAIGYESGSASRQVTFDQFPRSRSGMIGRLNDDVELINRGKSLNAGDVVLSFTPGSRLVDNADSRIFYFDDPAGSILTAPPTIWLSWTAGVADGAFNGTLHGVNLHGSYAEIDLASTAFTIYARKDFNITVYDVFVDDMVTPHSIVNMYSSTKQDKEIVVAISGLDPQTHKLRLAKSSTVVANFNQFIDLDLIQFDSHLWTFFLEGRAINKAQLTFSSSNTIAPVPIKIVINGVDRTVALGGPPAGFVTDQTNLDCTQFISAPGFHQIDFQYGSDDDTLLEATLAVGLFV